MEAEIDITGTLIINAETQLEGYAIQRWIEQNWKGCAKEISTNNMEFNWSDVPNVKATDFCKESNSLKTKSEFIQLYYDWLKTPTTGEMPFDKYIELMFK